MSYSTNNTTNNVNPKSCTFGCGLQIYWNTSTNEYYEVFTKRKHICPNRSTVSYNKKSSLLTAPSSVTTNIPTYYYNKKSFVSQQPKPKMDNSFELLTDVSSVSNIQKQYELLSDIVRDYNGKVHGSER